MSNLTTNANVTLQINGQQAQQTLTGLRENQDELESVEIYWG